MSNIKHRHDAAATVLLSIIDNFPNCVTLPEFKQVSQRQLDILRSIAFEKDTISFMKLYIDAVFELDEAINSMDYEERELLKVYKEGDDDIGLQ